MENNYWTTARRLKIAALFCELLRKLFLDKLAESQAVASDPTAAGLSLPLYQAKERYIFITFNVTKMYRFLFR